MFRADSWLRDVSCKIFWRLFVLQYKLQLQYRTVVNTKNIKA